jgi:hypothetical protein
MERFVPHDLLMPPPSHFCRAETRMAVTWWQRLPYDAEFRYKNKVRSMLELWFSQLKNATTPEEVVYNVMVNMDIFWHDKLDMIIKGERYPIIGQIGDYFVVIIWRDTRNRNKYGLFHRSLDTREADFGPEF